MEAISPTVTREVIDRTMVVTVRYWQPEEVSSYLACGGANYVGVIDDTTVLKYPHDRGNLDMLRKEASLYITLGPYEHLIAFKGLSKDGIRLERAAHNLRDYLVHATDAHRRGLCIQAIEAVVYFHSKRYIYCDIKVDNMVVSDCGTLKFCDLEGQLSNEDGTVAVVSTGHEDIKSRWPLAGEDEHSVATDLFALGTAMYQILHGHEPFPELDAYHHDEEILRRFGSLELPDLPTTALGGAIRKCWSGDYTKAEEVLEDAMRVVCPTPELAL